jgi:hypothetical protein
MRSRETDHSDPPAIAGCPIDGPNGPPIATVS